MLSAEDNTVRYAVHVVWRSHFKALRSKTVPLPMKDFELVPSNV